MRLTQVMQVEQDLLNAGRWFAQRGIKPIFVGSVPRQFRKQARATQQKKQARFKSCKDLDVLLPDDAFAEFAAAAEHVEIHTMNDYKGPTAIFRIPGVSVQVECTKEWPVHIPKKVIVAESIMIADNVSIMAEAHDYESLIEFDRKKDQDAIAESDPNDLVLRL